MTDYANQIDEAVVAHIRTGAADTSAADVREVFAQVSAAVRFLQGLAAGADILVAAGAPGSAAGKDGDLYLDTASLRLDAYQKQAGAWGAPFAQLKGKDGKTPKKGVDYTDGYTPQFGVDYHNGQNGKSAYELAQEGGFSGTLAQWLASLKAEDGKNGDPGTPGNVIHWEGYAPTLQANRAGDTWFYAISASKVAIYEGLGAADLATGSSWRLRFSSPDPVTTGGTGGSGSTNGVTLTTTGDGTKYLADDGTYKKVSAGSSLPAVTNNAGKALLTDGTTTMWGKVLDDTATSPSTGWSSQKLVSYIRSGTQYSFNFKTGDTSRRATFFNKVLLDSFRTCQGGASYTFSLVLSDGTVVTTASSIGAITVAIGSLSSQQLTNGYDIQLDYTGTANVATCVLQAFTA